MKQVSMLLSILWIACPSLAQYLPISPPIEVGLYKPTPFISKNKANIEHNIFLDSVRIEWGRE
jgi:hypothetical protein